MSWKKTKAPLLLVSVLVLAAAAAAHSKVAGVENHYMTNVFFSRPYEEEVVGLDGSLAVSPYCQGKTALSNCALNKDNPATNKMVPGNPYSGRGCKAYYQCPQGRG